MSSGSEEVGHRVVNSIQWSEALPWWLLFRGAGAAFAPSVILLASLGALATWAGWSVTNNLGLVPESVTNSIPVEQAEVIPEDTQDLLKTDGLSLSARTLPALQEGVKVLSTAGFDVVRLVSLPFMPSSSLSVAVGALIRLSWFVLVWSIFGTAISRHVALSFVGEETPGLIGGLRYGSQKWLSSFSAVCFIFIGIIVLSIPGALLGLLMRMDIGLAIAGAVWPIVLLGAVVLAILVIGMVVAWPLMIATIGVEQGDSFQAISTSFSYFYQRPLHVAFYGFIAFVVALPVFAAAGVLAETTGTLALWAASFGMGHDRTVVVLDGIRECVSGQCGQPWGMQAIAFWTRGLEWLLGSFGWGYFWSIATAAYFLLRQDVDGTELDEVVVDDVT
ncbi:MAG: hypothetical protein ABGW78_14645 [Pirellulales bacterium]